MDWTHHVEGDLVADRRGLIVYDSDRLKTCRGERLGVPSWQIDAQARFHPAGEIVTLVESSRGYEIVIPPGTTRLELWFRNWDARFYQAWDSRHGINYWFEVAAQSNLPFPV